MNQSLTIVLVIVVIILVGAVAFLLGDRNSYGPENQNEELPINDNEAMEESGEETEEDDGPSILPDALKPLGLEGELCNENSECGPTLYCAKTGINACKVETAGTCQKKAELCPAIFAPVCGCDRNTYSSSCSARRDGVNISKAGSC